MALSSNALCAKAKAMYGYRLNEESYSDLCRKQTLGEMVTYLKSQTKYSDVLKDVNVRNVRRRQLEAALNKEYFERCARLMKYAPKKNQDFYNQEVIGIEVQLIVDKVVSIKEKDQASFSLEIPDYLASKISFNIYGLVNVGNYKDLVMYLKNTRYYKILSNFDFTAPIDINLLERQLKSLYYDMYVDSIKSNFKGSKQKELMEILSTSIELANITKIYRFKKYFKESNETIRKSLYLEHCRISKAMLDSLIEARSGEEVLELLSNSKYKLYIGDKDYTYIEYYVEEIKYNIAKRYMRFSSNAPLVYLTYSILQKVEIDNLKHIIEGIRYKRDASSIEEMLIFA
ncbi:V-type ATPase subunit [Thomasclavelia spiroformis DSM 1552]|uniref:ATP synthase, subunit C n=1 Tax=Thomasclavelia spiroformis DSM 1552 TaxID=428126 RepID=B1BZA2_9FIRM|nr:V-type ATPase subunit [Thomasclavelia spiroformis]EDS75749.1 putative ATP synthase, subunit C [Thomasclavelia spiroformis DSM 1552]UWO89337.1 V-type ATPase subunit [Thomasclavelia spiroformis DSM 1552]